ncbi:MAG TPA: hypothetical protein PKA70_07835 [Saprospiraceae bacterium]|nr:hypothetical protein [Saprospiraceae bacterium]
MKHTISIPLICLLCLSGLFRQLLPAQNLSNLRDTVLTITAGKQTLDALSIVPASLRIVDIESQLLLDSSYYSLDNDAVIWKAPAMRLQQVRATFRVLPYNLGESYSRLDTTKALPAEEGVIGLSYNPYELDNERVSFGKLDYNGNFSRGIAFGNNQDLVLNSSFNLQMAGEIGEGIEVLAAITDENIPIQPEGNTQQLREFDRVFIQLSKNNTRLIAGDYDLNRPNSYFMNYFKRLQGATFSNQVKMGTGTWSNSGSIAISRGQFGRNQIEAQEGNQGPYKLRGSEGERFIIILAGTEKVWLDGALLTRGLEEDYLIDYNRGEVSFTNKQLITKDSRIIVEFEYSDQNYVRSLYAINSGYRSKNFDLHINFYNQQDSKNATGELGLSDDQKRILRDAGDDLSQALAPSLDTLDEFVPFRVAYKLENRILGCASNDTLIQVLVFSTNPDSALYTARFSFVGTGRGSYILDETQAANERVYRWVGLDGNCVALGDYEPVTPLEAPKQQQLLTMGTSYQLGLRSAIKAEAALSRNDLNRFSVLDSQDDWGLAGMAQIDRRFDMGKDSSWMLQSELAYEWVQATFKAINPYRNPEFIRDWSLSDIQGVGTVESREEQLLRANFMLSKKKLGSFHYGLSGFFRDSVYQGLRQEWRLAGSSIHWQVNLEGSLLQADAKGVRNRFFRPRANVVRIFPKMAGLQLGIYGEQEQNSRFETAIDTLQNSSFYYNRYKVFLEMPETEKYQAGASFSQRLDYAPVQDGFRQNTQATELNLNGKWLVKGRQNRLDWAYNFNFRQLRILESELSTQEPGQTFLGRSDVNLNLIKGVIQSNTTYEIGSGQEPKVEFTYVRVNPGEGNYVWLDSLYNRDGVIQANEMEIAPFQDQADYVRITTVTDDFIRTDNINFNQSLRLNPKAIWHSQTGVLKLFSRFSSLSSWSINRKTRKSDEVRPWNPFQLDIADTSLVAITSGIRSVLFFNQGNPTYDFQIGYSDNRNKFVQTTGFESQARTEQFAKTRWNISRTFSINANFSTGIRINDSEFFNNKDYRIVYQAVGPELSLLLSKNFRSSLRYQFRQDDNQQESSAAFAQSHDLNASMRYNQSAKSSFNLQFSYVNIQFEGVADSPVGFAILNGLRAGRNFLWNLSLDRQLSRNIQLRLSYEGRKTGEAKVVHTGRAQVSAAF